MDAELNSERLSTAGTPDGQAKLRIIDRKTAGIGGSGFGGNRRREVGRGFPDHRAPGMKAKQGVLAQLDEPSVEAGKIPRPG